MASTKRELKIKFNGRVIDHLGIQMYQSPVASISEMIANSWDADAEAVEVIIPDKITNISEIEIVDDGAGMTFSDCENKYLNVGWCRRGDKAIAKSKIKNRPILGRKGIGKFAGFGIADVIKIDTVSGETGERTVFQLDINKLRGEEYVEKESTAIEVENYERPSDSRKEKHGTKITLKNLKLKRSIPVDNFRVSMARRFLLHQTASDFSVKINGIKLPEDHRPASVEFEFPKDFKPDEIPNDTHVQNDWGVVTLTNGRKIKWRVVFYKEPIENEELREISVFSNGKITQNPFFFQLTGGLSGQHGQQYMSGYIQADYIDELDDDIISTERQRINWEHDETIPLLDWGKKYVKELLSLWKKKRGEERRRAVEAKVGGFSERLEKLQQHEKITVKKALTKLGGIETLNKEQFEDLADAVLTAWEKGRLRELIHNLSGKTNLTNDEFLNLLVEGRVLSALNVAEAVKTKLESIRGLKNMVEERRLEKAVRNYIAGDPWLLDPKWETFAVERSINHIIQKAAETSGLTGGEYKGRIDLVLSSGNHVLVIEFMRPGKKLDWDHLDRCRRYIREIRTAVEAETGLSIAYVSGVIVADELTDDSALKGEIEDLKKSDIVTYTWGGLIGKAERAWEEFLDILIERSPRDTRLSSVREYTSETMAGDDGNT